MSILTVVGLWSAILWPLSRDISDRFSKHSSLQEVSVSVSRTSSIPHFFHFFFYLKILKVKGLIAAGQESERNKEGRRGGFLPLSLSNPKPLLFLFPLTFLCATPTIWTPVAGYSGTRRLVCDHKIGRTPKLWLSDLFKGAESRSLYCLPYLKFNWSNNFKIRLTINNVKSLSNYYTGMLGPRAHSWHPSEAVGLLSDRLSVDYLTA